jgi:copper homeostasis protein
VKTIIIEICCGNAEDALRAADGGADRIELNSALALGGLTPSPAELIILKERYHIPVICMVRPREGNFIYSIDEYKCMKRDAEKLLEYGADGIVFGFLKEDGTADCERTADFCRLIGDRTKVFSRAIDLTGSVLEEAGRLLGCGVDRILTSGGESKAPEGIENIRSMIGLYGPDAILPGSGLNHENASEFVKRSGALQIHASLSKEVYENRMSKIDFGVPSLGDTGGRTAAVRFCPDRLKKLKENLSAELK